MKIIALPIWLVAAGYTFGQSGAACIASGSNLANPAAAFSLANNPAFAPSDKEIGFYGRNRFTGTDIANGGICGHLGLKHSAAGFNAAWDGTASFQRMKLEAALSQKFSDKLHLGISAGYTGLNQSGDYRDEGYITGSIGVYTQVSNAIKAAMVLSNPWLGTSTYPGFQRRADLAFHYSLNAETGFQIQFRSASAESAVAGLAIEHRFHKSVRFLAALQTGEEPLSCGIIVSHSALNFGFATAYHTHLGFSPAFSLHWTFK